MLPNVGQAPSEEKRDSLQVVQEPETGRCPEGVLRSGGHPKWDRGVWHMFSFTGLDIDAKEADVLLRPALTSEDGVVFLQAAMARRVTGPVEVLQADGGPELTGAFAKQARDYCDRYRIAHPYMKIEHAYIESFNRWDSRRCDCQYGQR